MCHRGSRQSPNMPPVFSLLCPGCGSQNGVEMLELQVDRGTTLRETSPVTVRVIVAKWPPNCYLIELFFSSLLPSSTNC